MIQLSLFVTREAALFAMVVKRYFPHPKILSKILTSLKEECFSSSKIDKVRAFYSISLISSMAIVSLRVEIGRGNSGRKKGRRRERRGE